MALSSERNTPRKIGDVLAFPVAADTTIYAGGIVVLADGYAEPAGEETGLRAVGIAESSVDNAGGAAGAETVLVRPGVYALKNSAAADEIAQANVGGLCYLVDDETVALTDGSGARSPAGVVVAVDSEGVWVQLGRELLAGAASIVLGTAMGSLEGDLETLQGRATALETAVGIPYTDEDDLATRVTALEGA